MSVQEYKCPSCGAPLQFGPGQQKMVCAYCDTELTLEAVQAYNAVLTESQEDSIEWEAYVPQEDASVQEQVNVFICPSCGGQIMVEATTAATFCPYCENPAIMQSRVSNGLKPDGIIPFKLPKEAAQDAFRRLCKNKPLLPKDFCSQQRVEKITGVYVPFWLFDCHASGQARYRATRTRTTQDARYHYVFTDHFLVTRSGSEEFVGVPVDGSKKMEDNYMQSIEPYQYDELTDFRTAYLSGFQADKYDISAEEAQPVANARIRQSLETDLQNTVRGYSSVVGESASVQVKAGKTRYVLLPVYMLNSRYEGKLYTFAMNGQTGKMVGQLPVCKKRKRAIFAAIAAGITVVGSVINALIQLL